MPSNNYRKCRKSALVRNVHLTLYLSCTNQDSFAINVSGLCAESEVQKASLGALPKKHSSILFLLRVSSEWEMQQHIFSSTNPIASFRHWQRSRNRGKCLALWEQLALIGSGHDLRATAKYTMAHLCSACPENPRREAVPGPLGAHPAKATRVL